MVNLEQTPETLAACEERIVKVEGPARSGKTETLVQRCVTLLEAGIAPENILVETSTAFAAQEFRTRLSKKIGIAADEVTIASPLQISISVLNSPVAQAATGRVPRLLNSGEYKFFLEDMKTLGQKPRRMRTMLTFFYSQWAALEPEDKWVLAGEEADMLAYVRSFLRSRGAMLIEELGFVCASYLQSSEGESARHAYSHVLCDDFQNLSKADQTVLCMLATDQLFIVGNAQQTVSLHTAYPYADGFSEFENVRHNVAVFNLPPREIPTHLNTEQAAGASERLDTSHLHGAFAVKWNTPEDELSEMTKFLRVAADKQAYSDSDIVAVVPNKRWAKLVASAMERRGFTCNSAGIQLGIGGDPRDEARCAALSAYTKLNLLAHPQDVVAWRSWCGIGNYLTNSDAWTHLCDLAKTCGISIYEALNQVASAEQELFLRSNALRDKFNEGRTFIEKNTGRKGFALLNTIGGTGLAEFSSLEQMIAGDETAEQVFELQQQLLIDPSYPDRLNAVRIITPERLCGLEAKLICFFGAVDGFFPTRDAFEIVSTDEERQHVLESGRRAFISAAAKANDLLVVSYFSKADLEIAEQTKMQVMRVKSEHGRRMALLRASQFIREDELDIPTVGGQQLIAELGL